MIDHAMETGRRVAAIEAAYEARERALVHSLERIGWSVVAFEICPIEWRARVELRSADGLLVTLDSDGLGRTTLTRERVYREVASVGRRGDRALVERVRSSFLGRDRCSGVRSGLRALAHYVADNAPTGRLPASDVRAMIAPLLSIPEVA